MDQTAEPIASYDTLVLNPHYSTMGLDGSDYWSDVLPRRVWAREHG